MEATNESLKFMNQEFIKLNKFDGTSFSRWKDKMMFLLTALKVSYVLDPNLPEIPAEKVDDNEAIKAQRLKRQEDEVLCRGHILNTLSDRLYDLFATVKSPKEIWQALEFKYNAEKQGADKFQIMKYFEFTMSDSISVMDQVHDLQVLVSKLKELKVDISESLQVGAIITKLPPSWNDYKKKLLHTTEDFTLEQIMKHLRIEEETRILQKKNGEHSSSGSKVNIVQEKSKSQSGGKNKRKFAEVANNVKEKTCYFCHKKGHFKRDCKFRKKQKKEVTNKANLIEHEVSELVAMISDLHIGMITESNMAASTKTTDWWCDSGATIHVCNNKILFKDFEDVANGQELLMGNQNTAKVFGKGSIEIQFTSGKKLLLVNVLYVPDIRKNLVSNLTR